MTPSEQQTPLIKRERRRYARPPIVESVLDIRYLPSSPQTQEDLHSKLSQLHGEWRSAGDITAHTVLIQSAPVAKIAASGQPVGVRFDSVDQRWVILLRQDGISISRLEPYDSWENLLEKAKSVVDVLGIETQARSLTRIALRTVNRLELPLPTPDLSVYLRTYPELSSEMPQMMSSFFMQLVIPEIGDNSLAANITQASVVSTKPDFGTMILDIDVYQESNLAPSISLAWQHFSELHDCRNALFESCITDATRSLFV